MARFPATELRRLNRRHLLLAGTCLVLAGCGRNDVEPEDEAPVDPNAPPVGSLAWAIAGSWRADGRPRDVWRHPLETLEFFEIAPDQTVIEMWPGAGYWTEILAPYLARGGGRLYCANFQVQRPEPGDDPASGNLATAQLVARFRERFENNRRIYGEIAMTEFGPTSGPLAPGGSADLVLFMSQLHNWMAAGIAEKAFGDAFAALRPGGTLGIEQHRAAVGSIQDPAAADGYVQEAFVKQLAAEAGFAFVASSEVNANPEDTRDHPFGVWTLPPERRSAPRGAAPNPSFDHSPYDAIGESDRMTLKFRKPTA